MYSRQHYTGKVNQFKYRCYLRTFTAFRRNRVKVFLLFSSYPTLCFLIFFQEKNTGMSAPAVDTVKRDPIFSIHGMRQLHQRGKRCLNTRVVSMSSKS